MGREAIDEIMKPDGGNGDVVDRRRTDRRHPVPARSRTAGVDVDDRLAAWEWHPDPGTGIAEIRSRHLGEAEDIEIETPRSREIVGLDRDVEQARQNTGHNITLRHPSMNRSSPSSCCATRRLASRRNGAAAAL